MAIDDDPRAAVLEHFGDGAPTGGDDGRPAGQGLDHDEAERLLPVHGKERGSRVPQELDLVLVPDLAEVLDRAAQMRFDVLREVRALRRLATLCRDLERQPGFLGDGDRVMAPLLGAILPRKATYSTSLSCPSAAATGPV
jgi:hypothetical protein